MAGARVGVNSCHQGSRLQSQCGGKSPEGQKAAACTRPSPGSGLEGVLDLPQGWPGPAHCAGDQRAEPSQALWVGLPPKDLGEDSGRQCPTPGAFAGMGPGGSLQEALTPQEEKHSVRQR